MKMIHPVKYGMTSNDRLSRRECTVCTISRKTRKGLNGNLIGDQVETTIHMDRCGAMKTKSCGENRYFLTMTVTPRRYTEVYFPHKRHEAQQYYHDFFMVSSYHEQKNKSCPCA